MIAHGPLLTAAPPSAVEAGTPVRRRLGIGPEVCLVLWQGILRPYKGVDFLLDAWQQVQARSACLAIVGGGDAGLERRSGRRCAR